MGKEQGERWSELCASDQNVTHCSGLVCNRLHELSAVEATVFGQPGIFHNPRVLFDLTLIAIRPCT